MFEHFELVKQNMVLRGFSPHTEEAYLRQIRFFLSYHKLPVEKLEDTHVRDYLQYLITSKDASHSMVNTAYSALKFFFEFALKKELIMKNIPRSKKIKRLPVVLSQEEIRRILCCINNLKHKTIIMTVYGGGLRVSEVAKLKVTDIDSANMQIRVEQGKGNVDRYTLLAQSNLEILRKYWTAYRPNHWLFPGFPDTKPMDTATIQRIFHTAKNKANIKKPASIHSLRHSFATHLLEDGTNLLYIQKFLGHSHISTTCRYLHLVRASILKVKSPLDHLDDAHE
jgi:integrase/recombinase XerD